MSEITKEKAQVDLVTLRDGLLKRSQTIDNVCEEDIAVYANGVLDMYNSFVQSLLNDNKNDTDITYEV